MNSLTKIPSVDMYDLLWKSALETKSVFSTLLEKLSHPLDIYENDKYLQFEIAAVGLRKEDIQVLCGDGQLRIKYNKKDEEDTKTSIYRGIKRSSFDFLWKISPKFDVNRVEASLDRGLLIIKIPKTLENTPHKVQIN